MFPKETETPFHPPKIENAMTKIINFINHCPGVEHVADLYLLVKSKLLETSLVILNLD